MVKDKQLVLIVDDEKDLADSIGQILLNTGNYKTEVVYSAPEAIGFIGKEKNIPLIILDIKMPEMDGLQFLQKLRLEYPESKTGVIILTAWEDVEKWQKARMGNVAGYLKKPFKADELIGYVDRFFSGKGKWMIEQTKWELLDKETHSSDEAS